MVVKRLIICIKMSNYGINYCRCDCQVLTKKYFIIKYRVLA